MPDTEHSAATPSRSSAQSNHQPFILSWPLLSGLALVFLIVVWALLHGTDNGLELSLWSGTVASVVFRLWICNQGLFRAQPERRFEALKQYDKALFALFVVVSLLFLRSNYFIDEYAMATPLCVAYLMVVSGLLVQSVSSQGLYITLALLAPLTLSIAAVWLLAQSLWLWLLLGSVSGFTLIVAGANSRRAARLAP